MKKNIQYVFFGFGAVFLMSVGLIVDRIGGIGIRSDGVSSRVSLSFSNPVMLGVPFHVRWTGQGNQHVGVAMHFISETQGFVVGSGTLSANFMRITIPCTVSQELARFELRDVSTMAVLASRPVIMLPPGPDCVR